jgi:hypothetical protein
MANDQTAWTIRSGGLAADTRVEIGARPIPLEPMVRDDLDSDNGSSH